MPDERRFRRFLPALDRVMRSNPLPEGALPVGSALILLGASVYLFLVLSARALEPHRYAGLSVLWALVVLVGPGFFHPIEQEVARLVSARRSRGVGGRPVAWRGAVIGFVVALALSAMSLALARPLLRELFQGEPLLLVGLVLSLFGYAFAHLARGVLAGTGQFRRYGVLLVLEAVTRLLMAFALVVAGVRTAGPFGLAVALPPLLAVAMVLATQRAVLAPGPVVPWSEVSSAIGYLVAGSVLAQVLVNAGPLAVKLLASATEQELTGRFLAALILTRVPLYLFQAVQAALLPKLARLASQGRQADFRTAVRRLAVLIVAVGVGTTFGALALGPQLMRAVFGSAYELGRFHLMRLAAASAALMLAHALGQALIALAGHRRSTLPWAAGTCGFLLVVGLGSGLLVRVEMALLAGAGVALAGMAWLLTLELARRPLTTAEPLLRSLRPEAEMIEP